MSKQKRKEKHTTIPTVQTKNFTSTLSIFSCKNLSFIFLFESFLSLSLIFPHAQCQKKIINFRPKKSFFWPKIFKGNFQFFSFQFKCTLKNIFFFFPSTLLQSKRKNFSSLNICLNERS